MSSRLEREENLRGARDSGFKGADATRTGFGANFEASFFHTISEDLSVSQAINEYFTKGTQEAELRRRAENGEIEEKVVKQFTSNPMGRSRERRVDWGGLGDHVNSLGDDSIKTREQLNQTLVDDAALIRKQYENVNSRSGLTGKIGSFAGGLAASIGDPVSMIPGAFIPAKAITAGTLAGRMGQRAMIGAGEAAIAEPIIQLQTANWKEQIGVEYGLKEMAVNAGMSVAASGLISGGGGSIVDAARVLRRRADEMRAIRTDASDRGREDVSEAADDAIDGTDQAVHEIENSPAHSLEEHDAQIKETIDAFDPSYEDNFDPDTWLNEPDLSVAESRKIELAEEHAASVEAAMAVPKKARLTKPKRKEGESDAEFADREAAAVESRDARQALFNQEADRLNAETKAKMEDVDAGTRPLAPLSKKPNEHVERAMKEFENHRYSDDPEIRQHAEAAINQVEIDEARVAKAEAFANCIGK